MVAARCLALIGSLGLGVATPASADVIRSSGPFRIEAPGALVAGTDATADITLVAEDDVTLVATAGTIGAPVRGTDGRMGARWSLPRTRFPQVAIIAALDGEGAVRDWISVPLAGHAKVKVDTRPGSMVTLRVGEREFGPVRASARGVATVPVEVLPGVTSATAIAIDRAGRRGESAVDLAAPSFQRVLALCHRSGDRVDLLSVEATGAPAAEAPVVTLSGARADPATQAGPGWFAVTVAADGATVDDVDVTAVAADARATAGTCRLRLPPEAPSALELATERASFVAGDGEIILRVTLAYPGRRRPAPAVLVAKADFGTVALVAADDPTQWIGRWALPADLGGRRTARVTIASTTEGAPLEASATITLAPEALHSIELDPPGTPRADGRAGTQLVARARDRHGNLVPVKTLTARATGETGRFELAADGSLVASYLAPRSRSLRRDRVVVTEPETGVSTSVEIALIPLDPLVRVDLRVGWIDNLGRVAAPVLAMEASVPLPVPRVAADRLRAGIATAAYRASLRAEADGEDLDVAVTAVSAVAHVSYARPLGPIEAGAGAGLGVVIVDASASSPSTGTVSRTQVRPLLMGSIQGRYPLGRIALLAAVEYWAARGDTGTVHGSVGGIVASVGVGARF